MRIAIDAMVLSSQDTGVGVWVRGLLGGLGRLAPAHEFVVYHGRDAGDLPGAGSGVSYSRVDVPNAVRPLRILWEQLVLPGLLRRDRIDVLHSPAYVRPVLSGVPTVLTVHDLFAFSHPEVCKRLNVAHFRLAVPPSVRSAAVLHCTSEWTRSELVRLFPDAADRAHVVAPAVDAAFQPDAAPGEAELVLGRWGLSRPPLLFVGNVEPKKNVPLLLEAFAAFRDRSGDDRPLLMVGGGGWRSKPVQAEAARLGLAGAVVQTGYVPREELPAIYRSALALVFPSRCEGFGLPPLEAMACGTPVICSDGSGLAESAGDAARLVRAGDCEELIEAMCEVSGSDELRQELSREGLARAAGFRWADRMPQLGRLYELAAAHR
jgi:glycosyltransferase involved in cell wall biosynthesis